MKRNIFVAFLLALCLALAVPAIACNTCGDLNHTGSADVKYYQDQSAAGAVGVTKTDYTEKACFNSQKSAFDLEATAFGAYDKVGSLGVLGVGQIEISGSTTQTRTIGSYGLHQYTTALTNQAQMQQLGGIAASSVGAAGAGGNIYQTQTLAQSGFAALPGGFATTCYTGTQTANVSAGAGN